MQQGFVHILYSRGWTSTTMQVGLQSRKIAMRLGRRTVMFNNDLQDGGSERAIDAFEELYETHPFTLSGRSLNCDAPFRLKRFIKKSGGEFRVDPISRRIMPAVIRGIEA